MRYVGVLAALGFVLAAAGTASATGVDLPDGWDPGTEGVWLLGSEPGSSWSQRLWCNVYDVKAVAYQVNVWTGDTTNSGGVAQSFKAPGLLVEHYGLPGPTPPWPVSYASFDGVDDALMWATGPADPSDYCQGDYVTVWLNQGFISNYPNPYKCTWTNTPEFVLQFQMYGYKKNDLTKTISRWANQEFYFDGTNWCSGTSQQQPSPAYASGASGHGVGAWTLNAPIPEPLTMLGMFLGLGGVGAYIRKRRMM